ncbi:MAG: 4Fe-4S binding protein, partial [Deltaproteobacteria bacterium]|nr:4Fe-4S binding protein [Deltaproteobacteria bacterium]
QASGAAAKALELAIQGKAEIPITMAWIDQDTCQGCLECIKQCTYGAIDFNEWRRVSMVNQAICKGCGDCANACPNGAAHIWQFSENQILTEHDGIMEGLQAVGM